jgi:tetratricopeptide (TPR) repeat protein
MLTQDANFQIYSQTGDVAAEGALRRFEQLRLFFEQSDLLGDAFRSGSRPALRVIGFGSKKEYDEYRLHPIADAYYASNESGDYIIMADLQTAEFGAIAAHEYAHYVVHASGLKLPACLNEGLAEFFSTLRSSDGGYELGGNLPRRTRTLRKAKWLPLAELLDSTNEFDMPDARERAQIFYAESWALADMLVTSSQYSTHFRELFAHFSSGSSPAQAFFQCYGASLADVEKSLAQWVGKTRPIHFAARSRAQTWTSHKSTLSSHEVGSLLASLSLVSGHLTDARLRYEALQREQPENPEFPAALGVIAFRQGERDEALAQWRRAVENKVTDPDLCYRYAVLAEEAGVRETSVKNALERAVALAPAFDEARFKLALIESHAGDYNSALQQLKAMRVPSGGRSYAYWIAMAAALTELDKRDEAKEAAGKALLAAQNEDDRMHARRMAYMAATDLTVQFSTDAEGRSQMVTTRIPHGTTEWNPFIEASDHVQHANGRLGEVLCTAGKLTGFLLRTPQGMLTVEVDDPMHVLMRNSPKEFFCGPIAEQPVEVDYAVIQIAGKPRNVLRGMKF